jgi:hypothetical protein
MMTMPADSSRRRFFFKAGAALSVPLTAGVAGAGAVDQPGSMAATDEMRRDVEAIRKLQQNLAREINAASVAGAAAYFVRTEDAAALAGISRLVPADFGEHDLVEIEPGGVAARAEFHCSVETRTPIEASGTLVDMARQQGEGFVRRRETRVLEARYAMREGRWKIERLRFRDA